MMERTPQDRLAGLTEQIRRDLAVLNGPPQYVSEREFYEERIAAARRMAIELQKECDR